MSLDSLLLLTLYFIPLQTLPFELNKIYKQNDFFYIENIIYKVISDGKALSDPKFKGTFNNLLDFSITTTQDGDFAFIIEENTTYTKISNVLVNTGKSKLFDIIIDGNLKYQFAGFKWMEGSFKKIVNLNNTSVNNYLFSGQDMYFLNKDITFDVKYFSQSEIYSIKSFIKYQLNYLLATPLLPNTNYKKGQFVYFGDGIYQIWADGDSGNILVSGSEPAGTVIFQNGFYVSKVSNRYGNREYFFARYDNLVNYQTIDADDSAIAFLIILLDEYIKTSHDISFLLEQSLVSGKTYLDLIKLAFNKSIETQIQNNLTLVFQNGINPMDGSIYDIKFKQDTDEVLRSVRSLLNVYKALNDNSQDTILNSYINTFTKGLEYLYDPKHQLFRVYYGQDLDVDLLNPTYVNSYYPLWHTQIFHYINNNEYNDIEKTSKAYNKFIQKYPNYWSEALLTNGVEGQPYFENTFVALKMGINYALPGSLEKIERLKYSSIFPVEAFTANSIKAIYNIQSQIAGGIMACETKCKYASLGFTDPVEFFQVKSGGNITQNSQYFLQFTENVSLKTLKSTKWLRGVNYSSEPRFDVEIIAKYNINTQQIFTNWGAVFNGYTLKVMEIEDIDLKKQYFRILLNKEKLNIAFVNES